MSDYMSYNDAFAVLSPYATQIKKVKPTEITWAQYQQLTPQQQAEKRYIITDYPLYGEEICEIKGAYDTLAELEQAHPSGNSGDAYLVGSPSHIYVWLVDDEEWSDAGAFTSITGPQGATGVGVSSVNINLNNHLIVTFDDSTVHDAGVIQGGGSSGVTVTGTLLANGWNNNQQTVTFSGYNSSMGGVVGVPSNSTGTQLLAYKDAGVYVVSQNGNQVTFGCENVPSIDLPVGIYTGGSSEERVIPSTPTTDGTYTLQVTVTSGSPVYSWVSTT